jgi:hypothetical protein
VPAWLLAEGVYQGILGSAGVMVVSPGTAGIDGVGRPARPGLAGCPAVPAAEPMVIT